jgi:hypothetical protein
MNIQVPEALHFDKEVFGCFALQTKAYMKIQALPHKIFLHKPRVGVPRIELGSHAPEARIMPLYYTPTRGSDFSPLKNFEGGAPCRIRTYDLSSVSGTL